MPLTGIFNLEQFKDQFGSLGLYCPILGKCVNESAVWSCIGLFFGVGFGQKIVLASQ